MSNRVIKDGIWASKKLANCSFLTQLHFPRLYLLIDDWSCFEIDLDVIKGTVYPKLSEVGLKDIEATLNDLEANGLLFIWSQNGTKYGYFTGSEEGRLEPPSRRHKRHTPEPPQKELNAYLKRFNNLQDQTTKAYKESSRTCKKGSKDLQLKTKSAPNLNLNLNLNPNPNLNPIKTKSAHCPRNFADVHFELAKFLEQRIRENVPYHKFKGKDYLESWANEFRLMEERDKIPLAGIKLVLEWSQQNSFWKKNILSADTFREKFGRLAAQMKESDPVASRVGENKYQPTDEEKKRTALIDKKRLELFERYSHDLDEARKRGNKDAWEKIQADIKIKLVEYARGLQGVTP